MKHFIKLLLLAFVLSSQLVLPQTKKQQDELLRISKEKSIEWQKSRDEAMSIAAKLNLPVKTVLPDGSFIELQRIERGIPIYKTSYNINSAKTISTNKVQPGSNYGFSLSGDNITLGIWDAGRVMAEHQEFTGGRVTQRDGATTNHPHSTHVAGTMIAAGVYAQAKGMSYTAHLDAYDWNNDLAEMANAAAYGLRVSNHSYGIIAGWLSNYFGDGRWVWFGDESVSSAEDYNYGFYDSEAQALDQVEYNAPYYLACQAAGNDRGGGPSTQPVEHWVFDRYGNRYLSTNVSAKNGGTYGYDCISHAALAKNIMTVGAVNPIVNGYTQPSDVIMSYFSGWGPTDDGRIKPDIVADGVSLTSCVSYSTTSYATMSGTSMATPSVAGSIGLILQEQRMLHGDVPLRASTIKGLIIETADEAGSYPGPDYTFGWGLMNTLSAVQLMRDNALHSSDFNIQELTLNNGATIQKSVYSDGTKPIKMTICWTDPPGTPINPTLNSRVKMLKNDLDLRVTINGTVYMPWMLDPNNPSYAAIRGDNTVDNVEQVYISNPPSGVVTVTINHKGTLTNGSQVFSLLMNGVSETVTVPSVTLVSPVNNATFTDNSKTFVWRTLSGSTSYRIQLSGLSDFSTTVKDTTITDTTINVSFPSTRMNYYWRVKGINNLNNIPWSGIWSFLKDTVAAPPPPPPPAPVTLVSPANNSTFTDNSKALTWNASNSYTSYRLQLSQVSNFSTTVKDTNMLGTSITVWFPNVKSTYYWRVLGINSQNNGSWSAAWSFIKDTVAPPPPPPPPPTTLTINLSDKTTCLGTNVELGTYVMQNGQKVITTVTGGSGNYTYYWYSAFSLQNSNTGDPTAVGPFASADFTLFVVDNQTGLSAWATKTIYVYQPTVTLPTQITIVKGSSAQLGANLSVTGGTSPYTYNWYASGGWTSTSPNPSVSPTSSQYYYLIVSDAKGCAADRRAIYVKVNSPRKSLSDDNGLNDNELTIFPNPVTNIMNLELNLPEKANIEIKVINMLGQEFKTLLLNDTDIYTGQIDLSDLSSGTYIVQMKYGDRTITQKIVKY